MTDDKQAKQQAFVAAVQQAVDVYGYTFKAIVKPRQYGDAFMLEPELVIVAVPQPVIPTEPNKEGEADGMA